MSSTTSTSTPPYDSKKLTLLALPYELRATIYDLLAPDLIIQPQYPVMIRRAFSPTPWDRHERLHPLADINAAVDADLLSLYRNHDDNRQPHQAYNPSTAAQPPFLPTKTTFRIWDTQNPLLKMHMDTFFALDGNAAGVHHVQYVFDGHYRGRLERCFAVLERFPRLRTLGIELRFEAGAVDGVSMERTKRRLRRTLRRWQRRMVARGEARVEWEVREFCVLEGEE